MLFLEFLSKILEKYTTEAILSFVVLKLLTSSTSIKGYVLLIYICDRLRLKAIFSFLMKDILEHPVQTKAHHLALKEFLKYVNNPNYASYMNHIVTTIVSELSNLLYVDSKDMPHKMLLLSRRQFVSLLENRVFELRLAHMQNVRDLVKSNLIVELFARKYLVWIELIYEVTSNRVKDLSINANNYQIYKGFLFIIQDFIKIYIDLVPFVINAINGEVKKDLK